MGRPITVVQGGWGTSTLWYRVNGLPPVIQGGWGTSTLWHSVDGAPHHCGTGWMGHLITVVHGGLGTSSL